MSFDERVLRVARTWGHTPERDRAVREFSRLGEHAAVWLAIGVVGGAIDAPRRGRWGRATATVAATYALNTLLKLLVRRHRPQLEGLPPLAGTPTRLSFPSAHASTAFAGAFVYERLGLPAPALYGLAGTLAWSRLYLGVHYPSDVLAGALLGTAVAAAQMPGPLAPATMNGAGPHVASTNGHGPTRPATATGDAL
ncbi:MAG TPA: phosphatase PAP2 family protein [Solirubrobacteraceae bacterium]|nr:phosphatase PAP2 family protein [Solirubrobacteraceae bacterium]